jgi:hypothetical protein
MEGEVYQPEKTKATKACTLVTVAVQQSCSD